MGGCARLNAEVYPDERFARFIQDNFIGKAAFKKREWPEAERRFVGPRRH